ncbi:netrin receptor DCC-like, partial [Empidonax traillii]|uniref:netrin receptor DCC-like n=1 Tax=Empidonax traillii TaxID=164674 RepID=UPI000FFCFBAA
GPVPSAPRDVAVTSVSSRLIRLAWRPPTEFPGNEGGYVIYYAREGEESLENLRKFTEYSLKFRAFNRQGLGIPSEELKITTLSDVPSAPPRNLSLEVVNSRSIKVSWLPPPGDSQNGFLTGYRIRHRKTGRKGEMETLEPTNLWYLVT